LRRSCPRSWTPAGITPARENYSRTSWTPC